MPYLIFKTNITRSEKFKADRRIFRGDKQFHHLLTYLDILCPVLTSFDENVHVEITNDLSVIHLDLINVLMVTRTLFGSVFW